MKKSGFTLVEMMAVIVIIAVICIVSAPLILNKIKDKTNDIDSATEQMVYESAKAYLSDTALEIGDTSTFCIPLNNLVNNGYLSETITDNKKISLSKVVKIENRDGNFTNYELVNSNQCIATNQTSITLKFLKNKAETACDIVSKTNCRNNSLNKINSYNNPSESLYPYALSYAYIGSNPSNLIKIGNNCFSIIGITNNDLVKLLYEGPSNGNSCSSLAKTNSYSMNNSWHSANVFTEFSSTTLKQILEYLRSDSNIGESSTFGDLTFTPDDKRQIVKSTFYTGKLNGNSLQEILLGEKQSTYEGYVGLANISDYIITSSNRNCTVETLKTQNNCGDSTFMNSKDGYLLMNTDINNPLAIINGLVSDVGNAQSLFIRPVIYINSNLKLNGSGTMNDPYIIKRVA